MSYHVPVFAKAECRFKYPGGGIYVDATFGGGGHAQAIFKKMKRGTLALLIKIRMLHKI